MNVPQTAYSILELAIVSKGSNIEDTYNNTIELAQQAEKNGYKRFWFAEHHNMASISSNAPSILITRVAAATTTIRVCSGGIMWRNHSPLVVAEQFGTLAHMFPNRIDLGLGRAPGTDQETAVAIRSDFMEASQHFPKDVDDIQRYFSLNNQISKVRAPVAEGTEVPIYILGSSTFSAHLAAKKGLSYAFASHFATAQLHQALEIYRNEFKPSETLQAPYIIAGINVVIADTDETAERIYTSTLKMIINLLTGKREQIGKPTEMTDDLREISKHPSVQQMTKYSFVGSKTSVKKQLKDFIDKTQVDELIVATNIYSHKDRLRSYELFAEIMKDLSAH